MFIFRLRVESGKGLGVLSYDHDGRNGECRFYSHLAFLDSHSRIRFRRRWILVRGAQPKHKVGALEDAGRGPNTSVTVEDTMRVTLEMYMGLAKVSDVRNAGTL